MFPAHINESNKIQSCEEHCRRTACYAMSDLEDVELGHVAYLAGLLHDCGKFTDEFANYLKASIYRNNARRGSVIHSFAGLAYLMRLHDESEGYEALALEVISYAIASHHGLFDCFDSNNNNGFLYRKNKQREYDNEAIDNFLLECAKKNELEDLFQKSVKEIEIAFNKTKSISSGNDELFYYAGLLTRLICSSVMDGDRKDTAEFMRLEYVFKDNSADFSLWKDCLDNLENFLDGYTTETEINLVRREMSDCCKEFAGNPSGIFRLNLPTGSGKTLSALRYALTHAQKYKKKRIVYAAPFISIIDQNADVIKKAIGNPDIVLEHHSNVVEQTDTCETAKKSDFLTDTWNSPIIVTTLVQLMNTLFSDKTSCVRRLEALCNSIIIIDEVQSVPTKMLSMFNLAMNFLNTICNASIVMCSATQPSLESLQHSLIISEKPVIPQEKHNRYSGVFKRTELKFAGSMSSNEIIDFVKKKTDEKRSVLVVCNTKKTAADIHTKIKGSGIECFHLSASMCMAHRKRTLNEINCALKEGRRIVCVSTQVIEAGVDISFDCVIRLTAGMDSVIQAAGRCNRNAENNKPSDVYIIRCLDEKLGPLTIIQDAQKAFNELIIAFEAKPDAFDNDLSSEKSIRFYYNKLYSSSAGNHFDFPIQNHPSLFEMLSSNTTYATDVTGSDKYIIRQAFKTAGELFEMYDNSSTTIIVPYLKGKELIAELCSNWVNYGTAQMRKLLTEAKSYSVSVYKEQCRKLIKCGAVIPILDGMILVALPENYDSDLGLVDAKRGKEENDVCNILIL